MFREPPTPLPCPSPVPPLNPAGKIPCVCMGVEVTSQHAREHARGGSAAAAGGGSELMAVRGARYLKRVAAGMMDAAHLQ